MHLLTAAARLSSSRLNRPERMRTTLLPIVCACLLLAGRIEVHAQGAQPDSSGGRSQRVPPVVARIEPHFTGNRAIASSALAEALRMKGVLVQRPDAVARISRELLSVYAARGFWLIALDSVHLQPRTDSTRMIAEITLDEGPQARIGDLAITGDTTLPAGEVERELDLGRNTPYSDEVLQAGIARILALYDRSGHPFASVRVADISVRHDDGDLFTDIRLVIDEGAEFRISEMSVQGNTLTNADVILRETRIGKNEPFNADRVSDIRGRLERLGFFSSVADPELYLRGEKGGLLLRVTEGSTNLFDGIIGYQPPRTDNEKPEITGLVNLSFRNIFGTGRRFDARWERAARSVSELELRYLEPWLLSFPVNLQGGFAQRQQDSTYVRRAFDAKATWLAGGGFHVSALVQNVRIIPSQTAGSAAPASGSTTSIGFELQYDSRDDVYNPRAGVLLRNSWSAGTKTATYAQSGATVSDAQQHIELDASVFHTVFPRTILAFLVHGRQLRASSIDAADLYRLGGANTLRGYREEQFTGTRLAWASLEGRYSLGRRSFAFAFFDMGYIYQPALGVVQSSEFTTVRKGYGIGGRIETALGILGISYALGQGDGLGSGKIHFGIVNEF